MIAKKTIVLIMVLGIFFSISTWSAYADEFDPFAGKSNITVATLGGSLTAGDGSDYIQAWAPSFVNNYLTNKYANKTFTLKNAGIGGSTSEFGMFRFSTDVASVNPDMVFIEFSVNDKYFPILGKQEELKRNLESLIMQCKALPSNPYVVFLLLTTAENETATGDIHKQVAEYYGIPVIDLRSYIHDVVLADGGDYDYCDYCAGTSSAQRLACPYHAGHGRCDNCCNKTVEEAAQCPNAAKHSLFYKLSGDGVHPGNAGYQIYYNRMVQLIDSNPQQYYKRPLDKELLYNNTTDIKALLTLNTYNFENIPKSSDWMVGDNNYTGPTGTSTKTYKTSVLGATMDFKFYGNTLAFLSYRGVNWGSFKVTVDKGTDKEISKEYIQYFETSLGYGNKTFQTFSLGNLNNGWHTAEIENIHNANYASDSIVLAYYITNSSVTMPEVKKITADGANILTANDSGTLPLGTREISVYFDGWFDAVNADKVSLLLNSSSTEYQGSYDAVNSCYTFVLSDEANVAGNVYKIIFDKSLACNGVQLSNDIVYYLTAESGLSFSNLSLTDISGNVLTPGNISSVKFGVTCNNFSSEGSENVSIIITHKNSSGKLKAVGSDTKNVIAGEGQNLNAQMSVSNVENGDYIQIYSWDINALTPQMESIIYSMDDLSLIQVGDNVNVFFAKPIALKNTLTNSDCSRNGNIISVTGSTSAEIVSVVIMNKQGKMVYLNSTVPDEYGNYAIDCVMKNIADEQHTVLVSSN